MWYLKIKGPNSLVPLWYVGYKLRPIIMSGCITLYHIGYVVVGKNQSHLVQMV